MAVLEIRKYPDKVLRQRCKEVPNIDGEIRRLFDDMAMTMYAVSGIGLAASQVGIDKRLIVIDVGKGLLKLINPKIIESKGTSVLEEGCLSVPDLYVKVKRAEEVTVQALNIDGKPELIKADGLLAHVFQQELDHLDGKLIIDYLPFYKRFLLTRRFK
ncbi:MAG: peptide deformylase [Candidatus Omnitrophica bacterium]|nr:peptide deformylase [Candidatus Omnitrophota bacterium]